MLSVGSILACRMAQGLLPTGCVNQYERKNENACHGDRFTRNVAGQWARHRERLEVLRPFGAIPGNPVLMRFATPTRKEERSKSHRGVCRSTYRAATLSRRR